MNKKIFTLVAVFGLAASSFTVGALTPTQVKGPNAAVPSLSSAGDKERVKEFKDGDLIYLNSNLMADDVLASATILTAGGAYLAFNGNDLISVTTAADPTFELAKNLVWKVKVIKPAQLDGAPTYQFTHVATGKLLSIDPTTKASWKTATAGTAAEFKTAATQASAKYKATSGISTWRWTETGLYALRGDGTATTDSVVYLGTGDATLLGTTETTLWGIAKANTAQIAVYSMGYESGATGNYKDFKTGTGIKENLAFANDRQPAAIALAAKDINNLNGTSAAQLQLFFNKNDVSTGKENVFTKYKLVADTLDAKNMNGVVNANGGTKNSATFYGLRAVGQTVKAPKDRALTGNATWATEEASYTTAAEETTADKLIDKAKYIVMDTVYYSGLESLITFKLDTLDESAKRAVNAANEATATGSLVYSAVPAKYRALNSYLFNIAINPMNDSIVITTLASSVPEKASAVEANTGSFWMTDATTPKVVSAANQLIVKELAGTRVVTMADNNTPIEASAADPLIQPYKATDAPVVGGDANFTAAQKKSVFYVVCKNETEKDGFDKYIVANPLDGGAKAYAATTSAAQPSTQFVLVPGAGDNYYTLTNRDNTGLTIEGAWYTVPNATDTYACGGDTIKLVDAKIAKLDNEVYKNKENDDYLGYFMASEKNLTNKTYTLSSASPLLKDYFLNADKDSTMFMGETEVTFNLVADGARAQYGPKVAGIDTLYKQAYKLMTKKDEYVYAKKDGYGLSKKAENTPLSFYLIATGDAEKFVLAHKTGAKKMGINLQTLVLESRGASATNDLFTIQIEAAPQSLITKPESVQIKALNGDLIGVDKDNNAIVARVGDLKSGYVKDDFMFWIDTIDFKAVTPSYYVIKGDTSVAAAASRLFMYNAADSAKNAVVKKENYTYASQPRVIFRQAERYGMDSLIVVNNAKADTIALEAQTGAKAYIQAGVANFRFQFVLADKTVSDEYLMMNNAGNYVQNVNGNLIITNAKENAMTTSVLDANDTPVDNEKLNASTFSVVVGNGSVTINNAAGKTIAISNILGQTLANTVLSSDNATISVPAGIVVVAVEGEAAVKAIVK